MASLAKKALRRARAVAKRLDELRAEGASDDLLGQYRRRATRNDPVLFALVYCSKHLTNPADGRVSLADIHVAWAKSAKSWRHRPEQPMADRRAEVAPRETGKSTWWFTLLPLWAAAHGHVSFAAAFADTDTQAQTHLASFKAELDGNPLIRLDYPDLVAPKTRGRGTVEADRVSLYHAKSGFVFAAAGMDSSNLGMKVGDKRPDLIILDDIEPHEGRYSAELAKKRLDTLQSAILPLNIYAHVIIAGTVTMVDSIIHQVVRRARGEQTEQNDWVDEQRIRARHTMPIVTDKHGHRVSVWPEKWPLDWLLAREHTREYAKNYANDPLGADGDYWALEDIQRAQMLGASFLPGATRKIVCVDPAVTTKKSSDYTGIAVIAWTPPPKGARGVGRCTVLEVRQVKKAGAELRRDVLDTVIRHNAGGILVETNQGGELWRTIFWGMPCRVRHIHQTEPKEVRAAAVLDDYQRGRVGHAPVEGQSLADYEGQMVAFPRAPHDDMVDAAGSGIAYFLQRKRRTVSLGGESVDYAA